MHIRQAEISSLETVGQFRMVEPQQMEECRMSIMHVDRVLGNIKPEIVRRTMDVSRPDPSTRKPKAEATIVVIPAILGLPHGRPSEFTAPDDHRILQESTFFQVAHQCRARLIGLFRVLFDIPLQGTMLIPNFMKQLNEPDVPFYKSPCQ